MTDTTSEEFFEAMYQQEADPWRFRTSAYEQSRYASIMDALAGHRFRHAFEPGCSVGALTLRLASICDRLNAIDLSPTAVERAKELCREAAGAHIRQGSLSTAMPDGPFDLIVLSEIGYYFTYEALREIGDRLIHRMTSGGILLAAHWLGLSPDHRLSGDRVHEILASLPSLCHQSAARHDGFRLEKWSRI